MKIRDIVQTITGKKKTLGVELWKELFKTAVQVNKENVNYSRMNSRASCFIGNSA